MTGALFWLLGKKTRVNNTLIITAGVILQFFLALLFIVLFVYRWATAVPKQEKLLFVFMKFSQFGDPKESMKQK